MLLKTLEAGYLGPGWCDVWRYTDAVIAWDSTDYASMFWLSVSYNILPPCSHTRFGHAFALRILSETSTWTNILLDRTRPLGWSRRRRRLTTRPRLLAAHSRRLTTRPGRLFTRTRGFTSPRPLTTRPPRLLIRSRMLLTRPRWLATRSRRRVTRLRRQLRPGLVLRDSLVPLLAPLPKLLDLGPRRHHHPEAPDDGSHDGIGPLVVPLGARDIESQPAVDDAQRDAAAPDDEVEVRPHLAFLYLLVDAVVDEAEDGLDNEQREQDEPNDGVIARPRV